eukprot:8770673-Pyramimonas_sp.AAC.1
MGGTLQDMEEAYQGLCESVEEELVWAYQIDPDDADFYRGRGGPPQFAFGPRAKARPVKGPKASFKGKKLMHLSDYFTQ